MSMVMDCAFNIENGVTIKITVTPQINSDFFMDYSLEFNLRLIKNSIRFKFVMMGLITLQKVK